MENKKRSTSHITRRFERTFLPHGGNPPQLDPKQPTTAVDELNLDERFYSEQEVKLIATRFARQSRNMHDVTSNDTITSYENWFKPENFKSVSSTHHNHASFVALVEGEIKNVEQAIDDAKGMFTSNNKIRLDTLTDLLNNIK